MKNLSKTLGIALVGLALTTTSCKKDSVAPVEETPTQNTPTLNMANRKALFNNLKTPSETYVVNSAVYSTHTCANGTKISISPNAFLTKSGGVVTGNVNIEVKDVLSKKDMILNNAIPVSNGQLLVSGGEVYFNATQGGQALKINPAGSVLFTVPAGTTPNFQMQEFYAKGTSDLSETNLNWNTPAVSTASMVGQDSTGSNVYNFYCDSVQWSNCDYYYNFTGAKTTCTVNTTGISNNSNTAIFISMNGTNVLTGIYTSDYANVSQAFVSYTNSLPVGSIYTVVAITFDGTNYFYGTQVVTMTANMVINMPALVQTSLTQIKTNLTTLP